jgi:hypothetical protein
LNLLDTFSKNLPSGLMKNCPVEAALFLAGGHDEANSHFSQFRQLA